MSRWKGCSDVEGACLREKARVQAHVEVKGRSEHMTPGIFWLSLRLPLFLIHARHCFGGLILPCWSPSLTMFIEWDEPGDHGGW